MNRKKVYVAAKEAKAFLEKVKLYNNRCEEDGMENYTKESAAVARASMNLTRALAKMRKSD